MSGTHLGHWFQQHEICLQIHLYHRSFYYDLACHESNSLCMPNEMYFFQSDEAFNGTFEESSYAAKFLSLFRAKNIASGKKLRNGLFVLCYNNYTNNRSKFPELFVSVSIQVAPEGLWAIEGPVDIANRSELDQDNEYRPSNFVLCTKKASASDKPHCHPGYFQCNDGTCVDDHLVCDGKQHCMRGEDETQCRDTCTDGISCTSNCSYFANCHCVRGYFQCHSGGCISVGKLCNGIQNCKDGSDEPLSCVFESAEKQRFMLEARWHMVRRKCPEVSYDELFLQSPAYINSPQVVHYSTSDSRCNSLFVGIRCFICSDDGTTVDLLEFDLPRYNLDRWCIYSYSRFPHGDYVHYPCVNGYHLSSCENMHCIDTFKCIRSYCVEWKYVCDSTCDCPQCEDESIYENISCPGMIVHESACGKVFCNEQADNRLAAVLIKSSSYDLFIHAQSEMCAEVLHCNDNITTWNNIVYLDLLYGTHLAKHPHVTFAMMEFLVYCNITFYNLSNEDAKYLSNAVAVQNLDLSHNNIRDSFSLVFRKMTQLVYLDLSSNLLTNLQRTFLCVSHDLKYLFLHNNKIVFLHSYMFNLLQHLSILYLQNNALRSRFVDSSLLQKQSSLANLSSDLPRLCCLVPPETQCSPPFTLFVTCSNMINSQFHVCLTWIIGVLTSMCSVMCTFILSFHLCVKQYIRSQIKQPLLLIMLFNITLADLIVSVCILSLSISNAVYQGSFGTYADIWRQSEACYSLEVAMFVCTECSLCFSVYLAAASYNQITSLVKKSYSSRRHVIVVVSIWISMVLLGISKLMIWDYYEANDFNYYCLPFQMMKTERPVIIGIQTGIISIDILSLAVYISIQVCLLRYLHDHAKETSGVLKSKVHNNKIVIRISCLITNNILTWTPVLIIQMFIMFGKNISPSTVLLVLLVSLPSNLLVNPIILVTPFVRQLKNRKPQPTRGKVKQL